jgi:hypothetical protein
MHGDADDSSAPSGERMVTTKHGHYWRGSRYPSVVTRGYEIASRPLIKIAASSFRIAPGAGFPKASSSSVVIPASKNLHIAHKPTFAAEV